MKVLVLGATGGTGRLIVRDALAKGHSVVALVRSKASADLPGVDMIEGDARDEGTLIRALNGCDGVVSSLGTGLSPFREVSLLTVATGALVTAMTRNGVRRLVCIGALGVGDSQPWPRRLRVRPAVPAFAAKPCLQGQGRSGSRDPRQLI
jgi:uncharacterized protein YbjT (DUF2867 family)